MTVPDGTLVCFYALNAHAVEYAELLPKYARTRLGHGQIPAAYISMIGVDTRFAGNRFGVDLLVDSLSRIAAVMLDVLDCGCPEFVQKRFKLYTGYGFVALSSQSLRLFLPISVVRQILN